MIKYSENHIWIKQIDNKWRCGITAYIKDKLGKLMHVEMPLKGTIFKNGEAVVILESSKSAIEVCAPCQGEVIAINNEVVHDINLINLQPEEAGWLFDFKPLDMSEMEQLLSLESYKEMIKEN